MVVRKSSNPQFMSARSQG